jgi:exopolysaccharide biosynthesis polyprenyl glycosylphosphotransferase
MSRQPNPRPLLGVADGLIAMIFAVSAVVWADWHRIPQAGLADFLETRVTPLNASFSIVFAVLWQQCMEALGLYRRFAGLPRLTLMTAVGVGIMTALLGLYLEARRALQPVPQILVAFFIVAFCYQMACVFLPGLRLRCRIADPEHVVIVGSGRRAAKAWRELRLQHHGAKYLLGFVDDRDADAMPPDIAGRLLGCIDDLPTYFLHHIVDELIVAAPARSCYDMAQRAVSMAEAAGVRVLCLNDLYSLQHDRKLRNCAAIFLELVPKDEAHRFAEAVKRTLDLAAAGVSLVVLAPLFLLIAVAIKLTSSGPVFFVQERYGCRRRRFRMWTFRSVVHHPPKFMTVLQTQDKDVGPSIVTQDSWITPVGNFLRRALLDELPQLWNVLLGDMSLVGPRAMSVQDLSLLSDVQLMRRFRVRPGITGNWQVAAAAPLSFAQCIELDFAYIDDWSLGLDLKILARTLPTVLRRSSAA